jgi:predicted dehydrogenase
MNCRVSRRHFLRGTTAGLAAVSIVPGHILGLNGAPPPSEKLNLAFIGVGGRGRTNLDELAKTCNVVAFCDLDDRRCADTLKKYPSVRRFRDYRKMLDEIGKEFDGVMIATPDHTHSVIAMRAMKMKKHVYCEKPLAHSIFEVRSLMAAARENKVVTQLGNQGHSFESVRRFCEMVWSGAIGNVQEIHTRMERIHSGISLLEKAHKGEPVPAGLDWDLWQGPTQPRPYSSCYVPGNWRNWRAFGGGGIGDWICHLVDPVYWALDLGAPSSIVAEPVDFDPVAHADTFATANTYRFEFPAKGKRPALKLVWNDGKKPAPEVPELEGEEFPRIGVVVIGDQGKIIYGSHGATSCRIIPDEKMLQYRKVEKQSTVMKSDGHYKEWVDACKSGKEAGSNFNYGGPLTEIALLGIIALNFPGQKLEWDGQTGQFKNMPAANKFLKPEFRSDWSL